MQATNEHECTQMYGVNPKTETLGMHTLSIERGVYGEVAAS